MLVMRFLIFIPTYNEKGNVSRLFKGILSLNLNCDILFLDDNSPDGTGKEIDDLARRHSNVFTIHRSKRSGIGSAHKEGITWAYNKGYGFLVTMDSDMTHSPVYIPKMIAKSNSDIVIASRFLSKRPMVGWNYLRTLMSIFSHFISASLLGLNYDVSNAYRLYNLKKIDSQVFNLIQSDSYSFFIESLYILKQNGYVISEVPATLYSRKYGRSKMRTKDIYLHFKTIASLKYRSMLKPAEIKLNA